MPISGVDPDFVPLDVKVDDAMIRVRFESGLELATPVARFPRLQKATPEQRNVWRLIGNGDGIHWPEVDEDISVRGLFFGARFPPANAIEEVPSLIGDLYKTTRRLNTIFQGRPFTPDGHLVGSIGEVVAEYVYGLTLERCSMPRIDARKNDRTIQIKLTGENGTAYGFRWSSKEEDVDCPDLLICLKLTAKGFEEIYNGPFPLDLLRGKSDQKNGQISISVSRLRERNPSALPHEHTFESINRWFVPQLSHVA
jgi:hypothetical protein